MLASDLDIFEDLRRRLISGEFPYGARLRADELRKSYKCSASVLREALLRLSTLGLADFQEQRGFRMPEYSIERQHDITSMRIMLESEGACRSMMSGGVDWESRLTAAHHRLSHIESRMSSLGMVDELPRLWSEAELEFHQTLVSSCGSPVLMELHLIVYHRYRQIKIEADAALTDLAANIKEHRNILEAAISGDQTIMRHRIFEHFKRHLSPAHEEQEALVAT